MKLEELFAALYPGAVQQDVGLRIDGTLNSFGAFIRASGPLRVYFADSSNYGHQANTAFLFDRLLTLSEYQGNVEFYLGNQDLVDILPNLIQGFREEYFRYRGCGVNVYAAEAQEPAAFGLCGGFDGAPGGLYTTLQTRLILCVQPYGWRMQKSFCYEGETRRLLFLDESIEEFSGKPFLYDDAIIGTFDATGWGWHPHFKAARALINGAKEGRFRLWPIYGLHVFSRIGRTVNDDYSRPAVILLSLALSALKCLQESQTKLPVLMTLLNYDKYYHTEAVDWAWDSLLQLVRGRADQFGKGICDLILGEEPDPGSVEHAAWQEKQDVLLESIVFPVLELRKAWGIAPGQRLTRLHLLNPGKDLPDTFSPGHVYVFPLGNVPQPVFNHLFYLSAFPPVFEGQATTSLAFHLGRPYLQESINTQSNNYPILPMCGAAGGEVSTYMNKLCQFLRRSPSDYMDSPETFPADLEALTQFFLAYTHEAPRLAALPLYFSALGSWARDKKNDKFTLAILAAKAGPVTPRAAPIPSGGADLEQLYQTLSAAAERGPVTLKDCLPDSYAAWYLPLLTEDGTFAVRVSPEDVVAETEEGALRRVRLQNAAWRFAWAGYRGELSFTAPTGLLETELVGKAQGETAFGCAPWLALEEPGVRLHLWENGLPPALFATGVLSGTQLHMAIDASGGPLRIVTGEFPTPLRAMEPFYALAGGIDFISALPAPLQTLGGFGLKRVCLQVDERCGRVTAMAFSMETPQPWQFCGRLSFAPRVEVRIQEPQALRDRTVSFEIGGQLQLGGGTILVSGRFPDFRLEALLSQGKIDLSEIAGLLGLDLDLKTSVDGFLLAVEPERQHYTAQLFLEAGWDFFGLFTVTGIGVEVEHNGGQAGFALSGALRLLPESQTPLNLSVRASYDGGRWQFKAVQRVAQTVSLGEILAQYADHTAALQADGGEDVELCRLEVSYATGSEDFCISARTSKPWEIPFLNLAIEAGAYVGRQKGAYFARIEAGVEWNHIPLTVWYDYSQSGPYSHSFGLTWDALTGAVSKDASGGWVGRLSLAPGATLGGIVGHMLAWCTGSPFTLDAPWNLLDSVPLSSCALVYQFNTKTVSLDVNLKTPIELGFCTVEGVSLRYQSGRPNPEENGVMISLAGSFVWNTGDGAVGDQRRLGPWNAAKPGSAPTPGGQGNKYLDLRLLALGQHVHIFDGPVQRVPEAMEQLRGLKPPEEGKLPPVGYAPDHGWLAGADLGVLRENVGTGYLVNLQIIFSDPDLYALWVKLEGTAAKVFAGLEFQVLYRKLSDTIGVFQAEVALPDRMRYLSIGAYRLTLPVFAFAVYTNGDFQIDVGFPWNRDFSRSFSIEGIVYPGIPVTGAAGFTFGRLSSATAGDLVPRADNGLFNPVLSFGLGVSIGIGKSIHYGILSGGFSVTVDGILEGVIAKWNPYALPEQPDGNLQSSYYFSIHGSVGLAGSLFGSIDFCVVKAAVRVGIDLYVDFLFGSYQDTVLTLCACVSAKASLTIHLGLFKIHISFSFSVRVKETLTIRSSGHAPWQLAGEGGTEGVLRTPDRLRALRGAPPAVSWDHMLLPETGKQTLRGYLLSAPAVAADEWGSGSAVPCTVALLSIDASDGCFGALCDALARWCVCCALGRDMTAQEAGEAILSEAEAEGADQALLDFSRGLRPLPAEQLDALLDGQFRLQITEQDRLMSMGGAGETAQGAFFPVPPALRINVSGAGTETAYSFGGFNALSNEALARLRELFDSLSVQFEEERKARQGPGEVQTHSVASWVFSDYFLLLCRQMVRALRDALRNLKYPLDDRQSCRDILDWVNARRAPDEAASYTLYDLFASNPDHRLSAGKTLRVAGAPYETVEGDTPALVAGRLGVDLAALADGPDGEANAAAPGLFSRSGDEWIDLPHLGSFRVSELLAEARRAGVYGKLSGMASRYYLHGLRLPTEGISPLADGMWVRDGALPPEAGLFALTGQQIPVPCGQAVALSFTGGPNWMELPKDYTLTIGPGSGEARRLEALAAYLDKGPLPLPCELLEETAFRPASWAFAPPAALGDTGKLWTLPAALLNLGPSALRPVLTLSLERYDEATGEMRGVPLTAFRYAALCSFRVRRTGVPGLYTVFCGGRQAPRRLESLLEACQAAPGLVASLTPCYHTERGYGYDPVEKTSFDLVQTDLSTETHPPVDLACAQGGAPDLLRLLWQALVTNNGGTSLRYWNAETGAGLPEEIFSGEGDAGLAFLAVLAPDGGRIPACCDCVVSGMSVPAGTNLYGVCAEQLVSVPYRGESPARLAADYLASVTDMARRCAGLTLQEGSLWTVRNALYPASAGAAPGLAAEAVAAYFAVSLRALQAANPWKKDWSAPFQEGEGVLIPPFTVKAKGAETLAALAGRCFLRAETLLWQNRESSGLFQDGQDVALNACPGGSCGGAAPGCVDLAFQRQTPGDVPDDPGAEGYAQAQLTNSFTLLRYRVEETPWYPASGGSAPVGPDENWRYGVSFPAAAYAGTSAYEMVGSVARLRFEWLDTYGSRLPGETGVQERLCLAGYTDSLIPLSRWPSCAASWRPEGDGEHPALLLLVSFSAQRYLASGGEGAQAAGQDLAVYETAAAQLSDPGGLTLALRTGLLARGESPFPEEARRGLTDYLRAIRTFLAKRAAGEEADPPERAWALRLPLAPADLSREPLFRVEVGIVARRNGPPMAGYEDAPQILEAESILPPESDDLPAFAQIFETAFRRFSLTASANDSNGGLWALRRQEAEGDGGLAFAFHTEEKPPVLYAPRPVSNRLESRTGVSVYRYTPGKLLSGDEMEPRSFQDVDLGVWLRELAQAVDSAFTPEAAAAARMLDRIRSEGAYQALTEAKRALAEALSKLLVPLYAGQEPVYAGIARESFRQRLLSGLGHLWDVRAAVLYRAETSSDLPDSDGIYPRLYGTLETEKGAPGLEITPAKLPLGPGREQVMAVTLQAPDVVRGENGAILPYLTLTAGYQPTHLEYEIRRPEGLGGYEDSGWLSLLQPKGYRRELGGVDIPLPLSSYPQTPTLPQQECAAGGDLWTWRYRFDYALDVHYPQSTLYCTVRYNEAGAVRRQDSGGLFQALARCHAVCGALSRDIAANAPAIQETTGPDSQEAQVLSAALRSLALVGDEVACAVQQEGGMGAERQRASGPEDCSFTIQECVGESGELVIRTEGARGVEILVAPERYRPELMEDGGFRYRGRDGTLLRADVGQAIPQRTVLLPQVSLFSCQSARATLYAEQNRNLVPGRTLAECFIFRTGEVTFPEPCFPLREVAEEVDLSACLGRQGTIREHLDAFFASLPRDTDALVQLQASHRHRLREGLPPVEAPIFLQTPVRLTAENRATLAAAWAEALSSWRKRRFDRLDWREEEGLRLELTVLSRLTREPAPMLILKNCVLPGAKLRQDPV